MTATGSQTGSPTTGANQSQSSTASSTSTSPGVTSDATSSGGETQSESVSESTAEAGCGTGCTTPPNDCYVSTGECIDGTCEYDVKAQDASCEDGDGCTLGDACDGAGACVSGASMDCERPNADGGSCVDGECQGWTCTDPYENCDDEWDNGCEIPTGVPNSCNNTGVADDDACGTAYCGIEFGPSAVNFMEENYRCVMCSNCRTPDADEVAWCNTTSGFWWPAEPGECPAFYEAAVCES